MTQPRGRLLAVFDTEVARHLLDLGRVLGYRTALVEPEPGRTDGAGGHAQEVGQGLHQVSVGSDTDIVVTDHHRDELGPVLRDALASPARWIGVMGSPRFEGPHVAALQELGVSDEDIARVHRPVGLNIGSQTPAEIALATAAGLVAEHNGRPGGFDFGVR